MSTIISVGLQKILQLQSKVHIYHSCVQSVVRYCALCRVMNNRRTLIVLRGTNRADNSASETVHTDWQVWTVHTDWQVWTVHTDWQVWTVHTNWPGWTVHTNWPGWTVHTYWQVWTVQCTYWLTGVDCAYWLTGVDCIYWLTWVDRTYWWTGVDCTYWLTGVDRTYWLTGVDCGAKLGHMTLRSRRPYRSRDPTHKVQLIKSIRLISCIC